MMVRVFASIFCYSRATEATSVRRWPQTASARSLVKERLGPQLAMLDADPAVAGRLFAGFDRIVVIDGSSEPFF